MITKRYACTTRVPYLTKFINDGLDDDKLDITIGEETTYKVLEVMIDDLVDFACEIREHEPTWKKE